MRSRADDAQVAKIETAATHRPQACAQEDALDQVRGQTADEPDRDPAARVFGARLGGEEGEASDHRDEEPRRGELAQLLDQAHTALRLIQSEQRENDERKKRRGEQSDGVAWRKIPAPEIDAIRDRAACRHEDGVGEPLHGVEERRVGSKQVACHGAQASSTMAVNARRNLSGANRSAFDRQVSCVIRPAAASNSPIAAAIAAADCSPYSTPVGAA